MDRRRAFSSGEEDADPGYNHFFDNRRPPSPIIVLNPIRHHSPTFFPPMPVGRSQENGRRNANRYYPYDDEPSSSRYRGFGYPRRTSSPVDDLESPRKRRRAFIEDEEMDESQKTEDSQNESANTIAILDNTKRPNLIDRLALALGTKKFCDVVFNVGECQAEMPINKFLLMIGSPVFARMLDPSSENLFIQETTEYEGRKVPLVKVPDVNQEAMKNLFNFLYSDKVALSMNTAFDTLYAARKYEVTDLEELCIDFICENMTINDAFVCLSKARFLGDKRLEKLCWTKLERNAKTAIKSKHFKEIDHGFLCEFLKNDYLRLSELEVFNAALDWAQEECRRQNLDESHENLKKVLGEAFYLIRFPTLSAKDFSEFVVDPGYLDEKDTISIYHYIATQNEKSGLYFSTKPRYDYQEKWGAIKLSDNEVNSKKFVLEYYCGKNYYLRPFRDSDSNEPIFDLTTLAFPLESVYRNKLGDGTVFISKDANCNSGRIMWSIDLSNVFVKSIFVDLGKFITDGIGKVDAFLNFGDLTHRIRGEPIKLREFDTSGAFLEIVVTLRGGSNDWKSARIFQTMLYSMERSMAIELEFY